jgi:Cu-Zn family superoxide dismutase
LFYSNPSFLKSGGTAMKGAIFFGFLCISTLTASASPGYAASSKAHAIANLVARDGRPIGTADFSATPHGVLIELNLRGLPPGAHSIQIHTSGNCDRKVAFTSAGPDLSSGPDRLHGLLAPHGGREGDLPNEFAASDGTLHASVITNSISLGNGKKTIFDADGASIIVHAKADDYITQPSGNSGDRIACGVIVRTVGPSTRKGGARGAHK